MTKQYKSKLLLSIGMKLQIKRAEVTVSFLKGFLSLSTTVVWGEITGCRRGCPMQRRMLSSIPGLYPQGPAASLSHSLGVVTTKNVFRHCKPSPGRQKYAGLRTSAPRKQKNPFALYLLRLDYSQLFLILEELAALPVRTVG